MKINYHRLMEEEIRNIKKAGVKPSLLIHSCCAPCSTHVIDVLSEFFEITVYFFNPNIFPENEYHKRLEEQIRLVKEMNLAYEVEVIGTEHEEETFYNAVKGLETIREGGERCWECFELRLDRTAQYASEKNYDYFATTLTISPLKNAQKINELGIRLEERYHVKYLRSDFKKKEGFKKSVLLSEKHDLYRQDYCGCVYSKKEAEERMNEKN